MIKSVNSYMDTLFVQLFSTGGSGTGSRSRNNPSAGTLISKKIGTYTIIGMDLE